jgi:light-harvesting protein B-800-850 alpha chain
MNQGRIWCVVHPTVGLPLFLASVALTSLAVHTAVMTHTTWMSNYWQGAAKKVAMENASPAVASVDPKTVPGYSFTVTPVPATDAKQPASFVITVSPTATAPATTQNASDETSSPTTDVAPIRQASVN